MTVSTQTRYVRQYGGGNSVLAASGDSDTIAYCKSFNDQPGRPVADAKGIQGIGDKYPREIITPMAVGTGTIQCEVWELWDGFAFEGFLKKVLGDDFTSSTQLDNRDLLGVLNFIRENDISLVLYRLDADRYGSKTSTNARLTTYHDCTITDIQNSANNVTNEMMESTATITLMYTYYSVTGNEWSGNLY